MVPLELDLQKSICNYFIEQSFNCQDPLASVVSPPETPVDWRSVVAAPEEELVVGVLMVGALVAVMLVFVD